jgi:predicted transcriptional regulator
MSHGGSAFHFVSSSPVRSGILKLLRDQSRGTADFIDRIDASKSAVYGGLNELETRGIVLEENGHWSLTGHGRILADVVWAGNRYGDFDEDLHAYFRSHDVSVLPTTFRFRIGNLRHADVMTAPKSQPQRVVNFVADKLRNATNINFFTRVIIDSYTDALPDTQATKLLLDEEIITSTISDKDRYDTVEDARVRFGSVPASMAITDDHLLLSLPTLDGQYDSQSEVVVETEEAREWGTQLFETFWNQSVPPEDFQSDM